MLPLKYLSFSLDTLFNHMAGVDSGTGVAGSSFTHYNYPGIYDFVVRISPLSSVHCSLC